MANNDRVDILFPPARVVGGDLYDPKTEDMEGRPLVYKNGPDAGKPRVDFYVAIAIAKDPSGRHWAHEDWGGKIWAAGHRQHASAGNIPTFAWKVTDGDSVVPNSKGNKPCDNEGWPGHWIVHLSSAYASKIYRLEGESAVVFPGEGAVMPGDIVEVAGNVGPNGSDLKPGVFINHNMVCFRGYSPLGRISLGVNPNSIGFGKAAAPTATNVPPASAAMPTSAPPAAPGAAPAPAPGGAAAPLPPNPPVTVAPPPSAVGAAPAPSVPVTPAPAMLGTAPPPAPGAPAAPAPAAGPVMTAKATTSYDEYRKAGWTDEQLRQHGLMQ